MVCLCQPLKECFSITNFIFPLIDFSWLHWVFFAARGLSLWCAGSPSAVALPWSTGQGEQAQWSWCLGPGALRRVGSSRTRDQTCVPCIGRWVLNHWTTEEVPDIFSLDTCTSFFFSFSLLKYSWFPVLC